MDPDGATSRVVEVERLEIQILMEAVFRHYQWDFRNYAYASLRRRVHNLMRETEVTTVSALQGRLLHDAAVMERLLAHLSVHVTSMFRDPSFWIALRDHVLPALRDEPMLRVWHAGCSTGEEVYSMAILLEEEGLYDRARLYATDMNEVALAAAREAIFPLRKLEDGARAYRESGGRFAFPSYYRADGEHGILRASLRRNLVFAQHNLVTDASFNEFHVILCRNVLIYFDRSLQQRVHRLLFDSLAPGGVIGVGRSESLVRTPYERQLPPIGPQLYRKLA